MQLHLMFSASIPSKETHRTFSHEILIYTRRLVSISTTICTPKAGQDCVLYQARAMIAAIKAVRNAIEGRI